jgi:hypothetical protein
MNVHMYSEQVVRSEQALAAQRSKHAWHLADYRLRRRATRPPLRRRMLRGFMVLPTLARRLRTRFGAVEPRLATPHHGQTVSAREDDAMSVLEGANQWSS